MFANSSLSAFLCQGLFDGGLQLEKIERFVDKIIGIFLERIQNDISFPQSRS